MTVTIKWEGRLLLLNSKYGKAMYMYWVYYTVSFGYTSSALEIRCRALNKYVFIVFVLMKIFASA